ncbi:MAG: hypothetical protein JWN48_2289 [Myxococcaceae bacterium]|nr:hypothetical protein [Myxococcaceae bacterium]
MKGEQREARALDACSYVGASLALALAGLYPGNNPDTFGHLAQGRQIAQLGHVPTFDTWSLLPGPPRPWHNYEWLSDLGTYLLYAELGYSAITLFKCALLVATAVALLRTAQLWAGTRAVVLTGLTLVSTIPAIRDRLSDRPHVLGICLAASYLLLLTMLQARSAARASQRQRALIVALLVSLHWSWVNAHGSHLLGFAITASFLVLGAREARRTLALTLVLQAVVSCASPFGSAIWLDAIDHVSDPRYRALVTEWQPWRAGDSRWLQVGPLLQAALLTVLSPRLWQASPSVRAVLPIAVLLGVACFRSQRFLPEYLLLSSPLLGVGLALLAADLTHRAFVGGASSVACALALTVPYAVSEISPKPFRLGASFDGLPRASGELLAKHGVAPRVFGAVQESWYLMFAAPESRFVIDGRLPFYGPEYVERVAQALVSVPHFEALRRELAFNVVVLAHAAPGTGQIGAQLAASPEWSLVSIEDLHATYVRAGALDAAGTRDNPPLTAMKPSYDMGWILERDALQHAQIERELQLLRAQPNVAGYRAWVEGVLALAPLRRGRASDGFRWPTSPQDWSRYRRARPLIRTASERAPSVPVVSALHAYLAAVFCDFAEAEQALERAMVEGRSREPMLAEQELALRRGQRDQVRAVVTAARALPQGARDPWLAELAAGIAAPPACPR